MFKIVKGDIFDQNPEAIAHGCNCQGVMGAGFAKIIKDNYPYCYRAYKLLCEEDQFQLGNLYIYDETLPVIYNLATQYYPGPDARLWAISMSMDSALLDAETRGLNSLHTVLIGGGIGGLKRDDIIEVFEALANKYTNVDLILCEI